MLFEYYTEVSVGGMVRLLARYRQTGNLKVRGKNEAGEIYLEAGCIVGTDRKGTNLKKRVLSLLLAREGKFHFQPENEIPAAARQGKLEEIENLLLEASRNSDPQEVVNYLPPPETVLQLAPVLDTQKILHLDMESDEWNVLIRINGEESLQMLYEKTSLKTGRMRQILYGLWSAGLVRKTRFRVSRVFEIASRELGNLGEALIREVFRKLGLDRNHMHMPELIQLLNELQRSITILMGPTKAEQIIELMWREAKP